MAPLNETNNSTYKPPPVPDAVSIVPSRSEINVLVEIANAMITARMPLPPGCTTPQALLVKFLYGRELGLSPMVSLYEIDLIEGRGSMNARTQVGIIRRRGLGDIRLVKQTDTEAVVRAWRADAPDDKFEFTFTLDDAKRADLLGRRTWKKYPRSQLLARAYTLATHALFQEAFLGIAYTAEELGAEDVDEEGRVEFIDISAVTGVKKKPTTEMTVSEGAKLAEGTTAPDAPTVPVDDERVRVSAAIKTMVTKILHLSSDDWTKVRRQWKRTDGSKMTFDDLVELREHLESLVLLDWMREALKIPPDSWQQAIERHGATCLFELGPQDAVEIEQKLAKRFSPFEYNKLTEQLSSQLGEKPKTPAKTTAGNG